MIIRIIDDEQREVYYKTDCVTFGLNAINFETERGEEKEIDFHNVMEIYE